MRSKNNENTTNNNMTTFSRRRSPAQRLATLKKKVIQTILMLSLLLGVSCSKTAGGGADNKSKPLLCFFTKKRQGNGASMCGAHSHNDYLQADPLSSALKHGLKSVEVDVFPRQGGLWVAHTVFGLNPKKTIESMYIKPLLNIFKKHDSGHSAPSVINNQYSPLAVPVNTRYGWVRRRRTPHQVWLKAYPRGGSDDNNNNNNNRPTAANRPQEVDNLNLLVDFKGDADESASLLQKSLAPLRPFLSKVDKHGIFHQGRLTVLISGNRPSVSSLQSATNDGERFLFLDGRVKDIHANTHTHLVPLVSLPWRNIRLARTIGRGEAYMRRVAAKAHAQGKLVRIWGCPNNDRTWRQMVRGNIDLLSIDDHAKFARFVAAKPCQRRSLSGPIKPTWSPV